MASDRSRTEDTQDQATAPLGGIHSDGSRVRRFRLEVVEGAEPRAACESVSDRCSVGSHDLNQLVIADPTVSRFHCEVRLEKEGAVVRDLSSRNGTIVDGVAVREAYLRGGSLLRLGRTMVRFDFSTESNPLPVSERTSFGPLVGNSIPMRAVFALLERAATSDATVLLEGETGTGKGAAAEALHLASARAGKPLVVVDCGAIAANLLESELFGHQKGAFTGAAGGRVGLLEEANGGTIFLDEIGEMPLDLQPKLLRALESREIRPVGANNTIPLDVRVVAATNRDLRAEVNAGRFRPDLFYRLAVVRIVMPPLRQRSEDLGLLMERLLDSLGVAEEQRVPLRTPEFQAALQHSTWSGNIRELRNFLERCVVLERALPVGETSSVPVEGQVDSSMPFSEARRRALDAFERRYLQGLLQAHQGKVSQAALSAGIDRVYLYRLLRRHGIKP
jgi:DNA-binding NtrC family response regulator